MGQPKITASLKEYEYSELREELESRGYHVYVDAQEDCELEHVEDLTSEEITHLFCEENGMTEMEIEKVDLFVENIETLNVDQWRAVFNSIQKLTKAEQKQLPSVYQNVTANPNA